MKFGKVVLSCVVILALSFLAACSGEKAARVTGSNGISEASSKESVEVKGELDVYGDVKVDKREEIIIDFPARVTEVYVKDGESVRKGDKLLSLDFEDYKLQIKTKENEIRMDELQLKQLMVDRNPRVIEADRIRDELRVKQGYVNTENDPDLVPLQNSLEIIEQSISTAKKQYEADQELFEAGFLAEEELKKSEQNLKSREKEKKDTLTSIEKIKTNRRLEVNGLQAQLKSTETQSSNSDTQKASNIDVLKLKIETSKLSLDVMKNKLNKAYLKGNDIVAPVDNVIIYDIYCMKGSEISIESGAVLKIMYQDTIYVTADIPEESLNFVKVGDSALIELADEGITDEISGKISRISSRAIEKDGDTIVEAIITVNQGKAFLKPGLTADIKVIHNQ